MGGVQLLQLFQLRLVLVQLLQPGQDQAFRQRDQRLVFNVQVKAQFGRSRLQPQQPCMARFLIGLFQAGKFLFRNAGFLLRRRR